MSLIYMWQCPNLAFLFRGRCSSPPPPLFLWVQIVLDNLQTYRFRRWARVVLPLRLLSILSWLLYIPLSADECGENAPKVSWMAGFSTQYVWRGIEFGEGPTIFPQLCLHKGNFSGTLYGAYTLDGKHREVDICLAYTYGNLSLALNDYYFVSPIGEYDSYFNYKDTHYIELYGTYWLQRVPVWITLSSYVFGADKNEGKQAYSSYAELGYRHQLDTQSSLSFHVGASLNRGFYTLYSKGFALSTIGIEYSRKLRFGSYTLPLSLSYSINPHREKGYINLGVTFR